MQQDKDKPGIEGTELEITLTMGDFPREHIIKLLENWEIELQEKSKTEHLNIIERMKPLQMLYNFKLMWMEEDLLNNKNKTKIN